MGKPQLYVFAGPNGAGKSTLSASMVPPGTSVFDGDIEFRKLKDVYYDLDESLLWANVNDVIFSEWKANAIRIKRDAAFETNFRSSEVIATVLKFMNSGFESRLVFMGLDSIEASIDRVKLRVAKGGHDVDVEFINMNYHNSLSNLYEYYHIFTSVHLYQNFQPPGEELLMTPLMTIINKKIYEAKENLPEWADHLRTIITH